MASVNDHNISSNWQSILENENGASCDNSKILRVTQGQTGTKNSQQVIPKRKDFMQIIAAHWREETQGTQMRMLNNNSSLKQSDAAYLTSGKQVANFPSNQFEVASTYGEGNTMVYKGKTRVCNSIVIVSASCVLRNCITNNVR